MSDVPDDELGGASGLLLQCLMCCDRDVRAVVSRHIVLIGGGASIPGVAAAVVEEANRRICTEEQWKDLRGLLGEVSTSDTREETDTTVGKRSLSLAPTPFVRSSLAWIGGSLFSCAQSNDGRFVRNEEYCLPEMRVPDWMSTDETDWRFNAVSTNVPIQSSAHTLSSMKSFRVTRTSSFAVTKRIKTDL
eukprot:CAMPEP_0182438886 /NCGR_PEP_ID=MMETSP1167-20130531/86080_1 /TAXON_ID=2988 /ORGANISM="Mallomonas Sp, Strain CCMP3275" /LENGTH=189 /DNA_ID=CAMNT_0024632423 /DNA_START=851 /DNA_END=1420 /DNA_ORIENTATION=-